MPSSLMQDFCIFEKAGETVESLSKAYISNTVCGRKYQAQVKEQRVYNENVLKAQEAPKTAQEGP